MNIIHLTYLMKYYHFSFHAWEDSAGLGTWSMLLPAENIAISSHVIGMLNGANDDNFAAQAFLLTAQWMPVELGYSVLDATARLEKRVMQFSGLETSRFDVWRAGVSDAYEYLVHIHTVHPELHGLDRYLGELPTAFPFPILTHREFNS